jgi:hypothetical protein
MEPPQAGVEQEKKTMMMRTGNWRCWRGAVSLTRVVDAGARFLRLFLCGDCRGKRRAASPPAPAQAGVVRLDRRPTLIVPFLVSTELAAERLRRQ